MKQKIEIDVPAGKKAVWEDGTLKFIDDKPSMPKTWEEFCEVHPLQPTEAFISSNSEPVTVIDWRTDFHRFVDADRNYLPTREAAEAHLALMQLHQLRDYYRQGWIPDWSNNDYKWGIFICRNKIRVDQIVNWASFLSFPTEYLATEFLNNFRDLIKQAGDLIYFSKP